MAFKVSFVIFCQVKESHFLSLFLFLNHHIIATFNDNYNGSANIHGKYKRETRKVQENFEIDILLNKNIMHEKKISSEKFDVIFLEAKKWF